jgi:hypothetical protein
MLSFEAICAASAVFVVISGTGAPAGRITVTLRSLACGPMHPTSASRQSARLIAPGLAR